MIFIYSNDFVQRGLAYNFLNLLLVSFAQHLFANIGKHLANMKINYVLEAYLKMHEIK